MGVHQLIDWPSLVYSPQHCEIVFFKRKSCTQVLCLIINHFVTVTIMYYSNLEKLHGYCIYKIIAVCCLYVCFHVLNVLFACVFSNTDTVSWLVQIKLYYSNL